MKNQKNYRYIISFSEGAYCIFDRWNSVAVRIGKLNTMIGLFKFASLVLYYTMFYDVKFIK
jgi:hypothetical protein